MPNNKLKQSENVAHIDYRCQWFCKKWFCAHLEFGLCKNASENQIDSKIVGFTVNHDCVLNMEWA